MSLDNLISKLCNIDLHKVMLHHGANTATTQNDPKFTAYFCPLCPDSSTPHFRISNGAHRGGLYNAPMFECYKRGVKGFGAIELHAALLGLSTTGADRLKVIASLCEIFKIDAPELKPENANGIATLLNPQDDCKLDLMPGFTPEGLAAIGCDMRRMYSKGKAIASEGKPLFVYSFGPNFNKHHGEVTNFDVERLHTEFHLYQLHSYTTSSFTHNKEKVSLCRKAHALFPIFAFVYEKDGKQWGQIIQPEWNSQVADPMKEGNFYFYNGGLSEFKVNTPLLGDEVSNLVFTGKMVKKAVAEVGTNEELKLTEFVLDYDEVNKKEIESERDLEEKEIRVENAILCKDGINAMCTYYRLNAIHEAYSFLPQYKKVFFHIVWTHKPAELLSTYMWTQLNKLAYNKFSLLDIDNAGKRRSFQIARRFNEMRMAFLPERMRQLPARFVGGAQKQGVDVISFFSNFRLNEDEQYRFDNDLSLLLLELITTSMPVKPLIYNAKTDKKTGRLLDYYYKLDNACVWQLMATEGYCREIDESTNDGVGRFLHIEGPFVRELDVKSLMAAVNQTLHGFAQRIARPLSSDYQKMSNAIIPAKDINDKSAVNLPVLDIDYMGGYGPQLDHFFYKNGVLRITPQAIEFLSYDEITFNVDRAEILPFDFQMPCRRGEQPFTLTENPEYAKRIAALEAHRQEADKYTQAQLDMEEREIQQWAQRNRWVFDFRNKEVKDWWQPLQVLRCFANDEHEREAEEQRHGRQLDEESMKSLYGRMANIIYSLGRPLYRYKGGGTNYLPYITENSVSKEGRSEGGSGKSVLVNVFMGCAGRIFKVNGRNFKVDSDINLELAKYIHHGHRVIHWEDYAKGVPIDPLFNYITSGFSYRQRHKDEQIVPLKQSPGHVVSSNYQQTYEDPSASGRVVPTGFSNRFNRGDIRKNKPARKISSIMPGLRDDPEDMSIELRSQIAYLCAMGVQFCMLAKDRVLPPMEELNRRSALAAMGDRFVDWVELFFSKPHNLKIPHDMNTLLSDYIEFSGVSDYKKDKFAIRTHREKMKEFAETIGISMPDVCYQNATDQKNGYLRMRTWCKEVYFEDQRIWSSFCQPKAIRTLKQSTNVVFFCKKGEEPESSLEVKRICNAFVRAGVDPEPILDEDGNPVVLTDEERERWEGWQNRQQGKSNYSAPAAPVVVAPTGEAAKPEDLPF